MGAPVSLLGDVRGFARDFARNRMPSGYLWDCVDFVPSLIEAPLTMRAGWGWGSTAVGGDFESGIVAPFVGGSQLLAQAADAHLYRVLQTAPYTATDLGAFIHSKQNPVMLGKLTAWFDRDGAVVPKLVDESGAITAMPASAPKSRYGAVWGAFLVSDGGPGNEHVAWFSRPVDLTLAYDANSFVPTALPITGLAAIRSAVLVFHSGLTERIRGSEPPHDSSEGDLILEPLFARVGCGDARSIAYWNDYCLFADEHGVHMTDGAVVRNLTTQGGISSYWRALYENQESVVGSTFLDYYIVSVISSLSPGDHATTLICDLNRRQWFRFQNVNSRCYIAAGSGAQMERLWAGQTHTSRLTRVGPCFFPPTGPLAVADEDGALVSPYFETSWFRLGQEGRKRIRFFYLSYDAPTVPGGVVQPNVVEIATYPDPQGGDSPVGSEILSLPSTISGYSRHRVPVNRLKYGVAFGVGFNSGFVACRVYDIGVEAAAIERSRV